MCLADAEGLIVEANPAATVRFGLEADAHGHLRDLFAPHETGVHHVACFVADLPGELGLRSGHYGVVTLHRPSNVDEPAQLLRLVDGGDRAAGHLRHRDGSRDQLAVGLRHLAVRQVEVVLEPDARMTAEQVEMIKDYFAEARAYLDHTVLGPRLRECAAALLALDWYFKFSAVMALMAPVILIVGMLMGFFTPTEIASVTVLYALLISSLFYRELTWQGILDASYETIRSSTGGTRTVLATAEVTFPIRGGPAFLRNVRGAAFVDAGQVWSSQDSLAARTRILTTPGVGLRFASPVGPFRLDLAYNPYGAVPGPLYGINERGELVPAPLLRSYRPREGRGFFQRLVIQVSLGNAL